VEMFHLIVRKLFELVKESLVATNFN